MYVIVILDLNNDRYSFWVLIPPSIGVSTNLVSMNVQVGVTHGSTVFGLIVYIQ